jgi:PAS domain S-box-containing protein
MGPRTLSRVWRPEALAVLAFACSSLSSSAQPSAARTVVGVYWSTEDFPGSQELDQAIRETLRLPEGPPIDYFSEYLESDRFPAAEASIALRDFIRAKYRGRHISAVVTATDVALRFALENRPYLFPDAPIVHVGVSTPDSRLRASGPGLTGVVVGASYTPNLRLALTLHPTTKRVFVVAQSGATDLEARVRAELRSFTSDVELVYSRAASLPGLLAEVKAAPPDTLIFYIRYSQEDPGNVLFPGDVARLVAEASPVPVYGAGSADIGTGIVGGAMTAEGTIGVQLGHMVRRVLEGTRAQDIPLEDAALVPTFDWRQIQRWRIDPARLPPGADIQFRVRTAWELYRWYILGATALMVFQAVMIGALIVLRSRRRETEARNTAVLRAMPDVMFVLAADGTCVDCHSPDESRLPVEPERLLRQMREVLPLEAAAPVDDAASRLMPRLTPTIVEYALQMPGGERDYEARVVACDDNQVLALVRDITERKRAESALRDSQERYTLATSAAGVGVWDWNLDTNEMYVDPLLKQILGYEDDEIGNRREDWVRLIHPDDAAAASERLNEHLRDDTPFFEVEHRMLHRDGSVRWFMTRGSAVRRDGGNRLVGTEADITERKRSEMALHELQAELGRMSRLTALGEFAASIAHEVRQPLAAILMNAKTCIMWLSSARPDLAEIRAALGDIVDAGNQADEVIERNRELFRHHTVQKAPLEINSVIREVSVLARARLQSSQVVVASSLALDLPTINADRVELQQVLLNLIANAIDAMEVVDPGTRRLEIVSALAHDGVKVSVRDNGVGLEDVDMKRIFTPTYTTKSEGTGVGLSISRSILEAHGGRLWAEQNSSGGATFSFTLPVHSPAAAAQTVAS